MSCCSKLCQIAGVGRNGSLLWPLWCSCHPSRHNLQSGCIVVEHTVTRVPLLKCFHCEETRRVDTHSQ